MTGMTAGISTACFYPMHTEEALRLICGIPVQCAEIFANCDEEVSLPYVKELKAIADASGTRIVSLHPYTSIIEPMLFFSGYERRFQQGRDLYKKYYEAAANMGARYIIFHGGSASADLEACRYFERYAALLDDAKSCGVELCHENVSRCVGRHLSFFDNLKQALPDAGFVFDLKQAIRSGHGVIDMAVQLGRSIRHIHISDHDDIHDCLTPGRGTFNIVELIAAMRQSGFSGTFTVELYRENFRDIVEISQGYQLISQFISTFT